MRIYIYISRTREKKEIVLFLGSLSPPLECEFYNRVSLCTSLIRFIFIGYRFPPSPLRHFYAIREIRVRETTRSSTEIFLCTINILLSLSLSFDPRRGHRFSPFSFSPLPDPWIEDLSSKGKIQSRLSVSLSRSIYRGEADLHRFTRDSKDGVGGEFWIWLVEKDLAAKRTRKGGEERGKGTRGEVPSRSNKNIYIAFSM